MGQKVNPHGLRVGIIKDWDSKWYAEEEFSDFLVEDYNIRKFLKKKLFSAGISKIEIERASDRVKVIIYTAKPGVVIGKGGAEIEVTKKELSKMTGKKVLVDIKEIKRPDKDAQLVAENIAQQLENRVSFRRAMKSCMGRTMKAGAQGIKTSVSGRLGGADMARTEFYSEGTIPLQTLRADIEYGFAEADTTYGKVGVKVWIYKGEVLPTKKNEEKTVQEVNPHGLRVGIIKDWDSKWYAEEEFSDFLVEDYNIRKFLKKKLFSAGISKIEIERASDRVKVIIYTAKPGVVIGKGGAEIEVTKKELSKMTGKKVLVDIKEIKRPDKDAQLVAENIAQQLENRVSFRRAMKSCMGRTMKAGAQGIKTSVSGRLGGADMARTEFYSEGTIPLQTLRADIEYGFAEADTTYGKVGVKVWIYKGEVLPTKKNEEKTVQEGSDK